MSRRSGRVMLAALAALALVACEPKHNGAVVADVSPAGWSAEEVVELCYHNLDTLTKRNVWVVARAEANHNHPPVELQVECMAPDSVCLEGSVVLRPTKHKGGSFVELRARWIEEAVPAKVGDYIFRLSHKGDQPIEGLWNVGVEFVIEN